MGVTDSDATTACERIAIAREACLPGVELKTISHAQSLWRVFHEKYAIVSPIRGASTRTFRGRSILRRVGELMLYEPGDFDTNTHFEPDTSFHVVSIEPHVLDALLSDGRSHAFSFIRADVTSATLSAAVQELADAMFERDEAAAVGALMLLVDELACEHLRDGSVSRVERASPRDQSMARVCERLHADLEGVLGLEQLAGEVKLDKYQLLRRFKAYCGTTPVAYRQALRIARARSMLRRGRRPSEIGGLLGFADFSHFRRTFVKYSGMTPNEYRRASPR